jgi:K+-sensing histidine kinase KdpD
MLTFGVCAVAVAFGRHFALLLTVISAVLYNYFGAELLFEFEIPTLSEVGFWFFNLAASFGLPELLTRREDIRAWWARRRNGGT